METHLPQKGGTAAPTFRPMCCGQTAGWIKIPLGTEVGLSLSHVVLDGDPAPSQERNTAIPILANVYCGCGETAVWIKMPFDTEVGIGPAPIFGPCLLWPNGCPSQLLLSTCYYEQLISKVLRYGTC